MCFLGHYRNIAQGQSNGLITRRSQVRSLVFRLNPLTMKKVVGNTDAKSVASKQKHEISYICSVFVRNGREIGESFTENLKPAELRQVMINLGTKKSPCRSRRKIYIALKGMGYKLVKR